MKVYVEIGAFIDVKEDEALKALKRIHESGVDAVGTATQYAEAVKTIESATGIKFYDSEKDNAEHGGLRIVRVTDNSLETILLEA